MEVFYATLGLNIFRSEIITTQPAIDWQNSNDGVEIDDRDGEDNSEEAEGGDSQFVDLLDVLDGDPSYDE